MKNAPYVKSIKVSNYKWPYYYYSFCKYDSQMRRSSLHATKTGVGANQSVMLLERHTTTRIYIGDVSGTPSNHSIISSAIDDLSKPHYAVKSTGYICCTGVRMAMRSTPVRLAISLSKVAAALVAKGRKRNLNCNSHDTNTRDNRGDGLLRNERELVSDQCRVHSMTPTSNVPPSFVLSPSLDNMPLIHLAPTTGVDHDNTDAKCPSIATDAADKKVSIIEEDDNLADDVSSTSPRMAEKAPLINAHTHELNGARTPRVYVQYNDALLAQLLSTHPITANHIEYLIAVTFKDILKISDTLSDVVISDETNRSPNSLSNMISEAFAVEKDRVQPHTGSNNSRLRPTRKDGNKPIIRSFFAEAEKRRQEEIEKERGGGNNKNIQYNGIPQEKGIPSSASSLAPTVQMQSLSASEVTAHGVVAIALLMYEETIMSGGLISSDYCMGESKSLVSATPSVFSPEHILKIMYHLSYLHSNFGCFSWANVTAVVEQGMLWSNEAIADGHDSTYIKRSNARSMPPPSTLARFLLNVHLRYSEKNSPLEHALEHANDDRYSNRDILQAEKIEKKRNDVNEEKRDCTNKGTQVNTVTELPSSSLASVFLFDVSAVFVGGIYQRLVVPQYNSHPALLPSSPDRQGRNIPPYLLLTTEELFITVQSLHGGEMGMGCTLQHAATSTVLEHLLVQEIVIRLINSVKRQVLYQEIIEEYFLLPLRDAMASDYSESRGFGDCFQYKDNGEREGIPRTSQQELPPSLGALQEEEGMQLLVALNPLYNTSFHTPSPTSHSQPVLGFHSGFGHNIGTLITSHHSYKDVIVIDGGLVDRIRKKTQDTDDTATYLKYNKKFLQKLLILLELSKIHQEGSGDEGCANHTNAAENDTTPILVRVAMSPVNILCSVFHDLAKSWRRIRNGCPAFFWVDHTNKYIKKGDSNSHAIEKEKKAAQEIFRKYLVAECNISDHARSPSDSTQKPTQSTSGLSLFSVEYFDTLGKHFAQTIRFTGFLRESRRELEAMIAKVHHRQMECGRYGVGNRQLSPQLSNFHTFSDITTASDPPCDSVAVGREGTSDKREHDNVPSLLHTSHPSSHSSSFIAPSCRSQDTRSHISVPVAADKRKYKCSTSIGAALFSSEMELKKQRYISRLNIRELQQKHEDKNVEVGRDNEIHSYTPGDKISNAKIEMITPRSFVLNHQQRQHQQPHNSSLCFPQTSLSTSRPFSLTTLASMVLSSGLLTSERISCSGRNMNKKKETSDGGTYSATILTPLSLKYLLISFLTLPYFHVELVSLVTNTILEPLLDTTSKTHKNEMKVTVDKDVPISSTSSLHSSSSMDNILSQIVSVTISLLGRPDIIIEPPRRLLDLLLRCTIAAEGRMGSAVNMVPTPMFDGSKSSSSCHSHSSAPQLKREGVTMGASTSDVSLYHGRLSFLSPSHVHGLRSIINYSMDGLLPFVDALHLLQLREFEFAWAATVKGAHQRVRVTSSYSDDNKLEPLHITTHPLWGTVISSITLWQVPVAALVDVSGSLSSCLHGVGKVLRSASIGQGTSGTSKGAQQHVDVLKRMVMLLRSASEKLHTFCKRIAVNPSYYYQSIPVDGNDNAMMYDNAPLSLLPKPLNPTEQCAAVIFAPHSSLVAHYMLLIMTLFTCNIGDSPCTGGVFLQHLLALGPWLLRNGVNKRTSGSALLEGLQMALGVVSEDAATNGPFSNPSRSLSFAVTRALLGLTPLSSSMDDISLLRKIILMYSKEVSQRSAQSKDIESCPGDHHLLLALEEYKHIIGYIRNLSSPIGYSENAGDNSDKSGNQNRHPEERRTGIVPHQVSGTLRAALVRAYKLTDEVANRVIGVEESSNDMIQEPTIDCDEGVLSMMDTQESKRIVMQSPDTNRTDSCITESSDEEPFQEKEIDYASDYEDELHQKSQLTPTLGIVRVDSGDGHRRIYKYTSNSMPLHLLLSRSDQTRYPRTPVEVHGLLMTVVRAPIYRHLFLLPVESNRINDRKSLELRKAASDMEDKMDLMTWFEGSFPPQRSLKQNNSIDGSTIVNTNAKNYNHVSNRRIMDEVVFWRTPASSSSPSRQQLGKTDNKSPFLPILKMRPTNVGMETSNMMREGAVIDLVASRIHECLKICWTSDNSKNTLLTQVLYILHYPKPPSPLSSGPYAAQQATIDALAHLLLEDTIKFYSSLLLEVTVPKSDRHRSQNHSEGSGGVIVDAYNDILRDSMLMATSNSDLPRHSTAARVNSLCDSTTTHVAALSPTHQRMPRQLGHDFVLRLFKQKGNCEQNTSIPNSRECNSGTKITGKDGNSTCDSTPASLDSDMYCPPSRDHESPKAILTGDTVCPFYKEAIKGEMVLSWGRQEARLDLILSMAWEITR